MNKGQVACALGGAACALLGAFFGLKNDYDKEQEEKLIIAQSAEKGAMKYLMAKERSDDEEES